MRNSATVRRFFGVVLVCAFACGSTACQKGGDSSAAGTQHPVESPLTSGFGQRAPAFESSYESFRMGDEKGNGGDAVVCFSSQPVRDRVRRHLLENRGSPHPTNPFEDAATLADVSSVELLDVYEYKLPTGFPPVQRDLISISRPFTEELIPFIKRVSQKTELGIRLEENLHDIPLRNWKASPGVIEIDDSTESIILPQSCLLVQLAARRENVIFYDAILFGRLDELNRLALVIHELTYKVAVSLKQSNSSLARQAVGLLLSKSEFDSLSPMEMNARLQPFGAFGFPYLVQGQTVWIDKVVEMHPGGKPKIVSLLARERLDVDGLSITVEEPANASLFLEPNGDVTRVYGSLPSDGFKNGVPSWMNFDENGKLSSLVRDSASDFAWKGVDFGTIKTASFENGELISLVAHSANIPTTWGEMSGSGLVTLHPGSLRIDKVQMLSSSAVRTRFGYLTFAGCAELDAQGNIIYAEGVTAESNGFARPLELPSGVQLAVVKASLRFSPTGDIEWFKRGQKLFGNEMEITASEPTHRWINLKDVIEASFYPGNTLQEVKLSDNGEVGLGGTTKKVGVITLEFDPSGALITKL